MRSTIISLALIIVVLISIVPILKADEDTVYPLKDGSSISKSDILSFERNITLEYKKDYEWNPPTNKQLDYLFELKQPTDFITFLSYYGTIGIAIKKNKPIIFFGIEIPWIRVTSNYIIYENQSQDFNFLGFFGASKGANVVDIRFYDISINDENYKYGYVTNVSYLTPDLSRFLALDYYLLDFADYVQKNASLNKINKEKQRQLEDLFNKYQMAFQSGDELEMALYREKFYHFAVYEMEESDEGAKKIWGTYINKDSKNMNSISESMNKESNNSELHPHWYTLVAVVCIILSAVVLPKTERLRAKFQKEGRLGLIAYVTITITYLIGGKTYFTFLIPNNIPHYCVAIITIIWIFGLIYIYKYEVPIREDK